MRAGVTVAVGVLRAGVARAAGAVGARAAGVVGARVAGNVVELRRDVGDGLLERPAGAELLDEGERWGVVLAEAVLRVSRKGVLRGRGPWPWRKGIWPLGASAGRSGVRWRRRLAGGTECPVMRWSWRRLESERRVVLPVLGR